ncbi:MAG: DJ-1 family glyoxalase III [bacterium]
MSKPKVLAIVSNGVEEMELVITVDILRRGGVDVDIVSIQDYNITCSRMVKIVADKLLDEVNLDEYQAIFIPGGSENAKNLKNDQRVGKIIKDFMEKQKLVAAICAGPTVINHHVSLHGYKATCYPSLKDEIPNYMDQPVVEDDFLVTSQGPATTFQFALTLLAKLKNDQTKDTISKNILMDRSFSLQR